MKTFIIYHCNRDDNFSAHHAVTFAKAVEMRQDITFDYDKYCNLCKIFGVLPTSELSFTAWKYAREPY